MEVLFDLISFYQKDILISYVFADIDECTTGIDACAANAKCIDTVGSYDCECYKGFSGNGRNCTGRIYIMVKLQWSHMWKGYTVTLIIATTKG